MLGAARGDMTILAARATGSGQALGADFSGSWKWKRAYSLR